jgi:NitT/TauT family transport system substrate-binding protein
MMVIEHDHLFEKRLAAAGRTGVAVRWSLLGGGSAVNDALLSGSVDIASGGLAPFILLWARAKATLEVRAISALDSLPLWFNTRDPDVKSLEDHTSKDKIAVTAPKISVHAILLQIAASKRWGMQDYAHFDALTVTASQPDGTAELLSGAVSSHFTAPPFQNAEVKQPGIRTITTGEDILGGPATFIVTCATAKFQAENPVTVKAFLAATEDAIAYINSNPKQSIAIYKEMSHDDTPASVLLPVLLDPATHFTTTPQNVMTFADFMYRIGTIKTQPQSWKDMFYAGVHDLPGS